MTKGFELGDAVSYMLIAGGVYLAYRLSVQGSFGLEAQHAAQELQKALASTSSGLTGSGTSNQQIPAAAGSGPPASASAPPATNKYPFIAGYRYVDYNPQQGKWAVVLQGNVAEWFAYQRDAEAYYNAHVAANP